MKWERIGESASYIDVGMRHDGKLHPSQTDTEIAYTPVCRVKKHAYTAMLLPIVLAAPDLLAACEAALAWLCNCNTSDPAALGRQIMAAMEKAGIPKSELDAAAVALVRGPCSVPNLIGRDDDELVTARKGGAA